VTPKAFSALPPAKIRFIVPMYARLVNELPEGKDWLYHRIPPGVYHRNLQVTEEESLGYSDSDEGVALGVSGLFIWAHTV